MLTTLLFIYLTFALLSVVGEWDSFVIDRTGLLFLSFLPVINILFGLVGLVKIIKKFHPANFCYTGHNKKKVFDSRTDSFLKVERHFESHRCSKCLKIWKNKV